MIRSLGARIIYCGIAVVLLAGAVLLIVYKKPKKTFVVLGGNEIVVTVVDTPEQRALGLGFRKGLADDEGMLFIFQNSLSYGFWMKDMNFPIDIIWFDANKRVIYVKEGAEPASYPEVFTPSTPALYVLEVQSGFFAAHHLKLGDSFKIR